MIKPSNYDNVITGDFVPPAVGGHHLVIMAAKEQTTKTGKPMLVVYVDFAYNDSQPQYFKKLYDTDIRPDKKWPHGGTIYIVSVDQDGQCSRNFKSFITSLCESNGLKDINWVDGPAFAEQFKGKIIGGVYGRVEEEYNGERRWRTLHRYFCSDAKVDSVKAPADKAIPETPATAMSSAVPSVPVPNPVDKPSDFPW